MDEEKSVVSMSVFSVFHFSAAHTKSNMTNCEKLLTNPLVCWKTLVKYGIYGFCDTGSTFADSYIHDLVPFDW